MRQLILKLRENSGRAPSRAWIYNSVKLAIDESDFKSVDSYRHLGHTQKLMLTYVNDANKKQALVEEAAERKYTVAQLMKMINQENGGKESRQLPGFDKAPGIEELQSIGKEHLELHLDKLRKKIENYKSCLQIFEESLALANDMQKSTEA